MVLASGGLQLTKIGSFAKFEGGIFWISSSFLWTHFPANFRVSDIRKIEIKTIFLVSGYLSLAVKSNAQE